MSLQHVKALVETAKAAAQHHPLLKGEALAIIAKAEVEIAALEGAAKTLDANLAAQVFASEPGAVSEALDLIEIIAKEAP